MKIILKGKEARSALREGINLVADCLKVTLGPQGRNATLARKSTLPLTTNDGKTVSDYIESNNPAVQQGVLKAREASSLTEIYAKDGTTTVSVLLQALVNECLDKIDNSDSLVKTKFNVVKLSREIETACQKVVEELRKMSKPISKKEDIYKTALASVEVPELAEIITKIFLQIGKDGVILVEEGQRETEFEVTCGMDINAGLVSGDFMITSEDIVLNDVDIYVTLENISNVDQILPKINEVSIKGGQELVIMATDFHPDVVKAFLKNNLSGGLSVYPIKITTVDKTYKPEDIKAMLGGELGRCDSVNINTERISLFGGRGDASEHIKTLKKEYRVSTSEFDKEALQKRISSLSGGVAVIKVGANSQSEREYLRDKLDDAVYATKFAMQEGVVPGAGMALKIISEKLPENILTKTLRTPYDQLIDNSCGEMLITEEIVDPVRVTISALQNACSVVKSVVTTEILVVDENENKPRTEE